MEEKLEIKTGQPIERKIDLNKSIKELREFVDNEKEMIKQGHKENATVELLALGYALDFIDFADDSADIKLDFKEDNVINLERFIDGLCQAIEKEPVPDKNLQILITQAACYFSFIILKNIGGNFIQSNLGLALSIEGNNAFVYNRIGRRFTKGRDAEIISFYEALKQIHAEENKNKDKNKNNDENN